MGLQWEAVIVNSLDPTMLGRWWSEALGWPAEVDSDGDVIIRPAPGAQPEIMFLAVAEPKRVQNRLHLDFRPDDQASEVRRLLELGAIHADVGQGEQTWVVLADPEGNEFCVLDSRKQ